MTNIQTVFFNNNLIKEEEETEHLRQQINEKIKSTANTNNINDKSEYGDTKLYTATIYGLTDTIKLLLDLNANPLIANHNGSTALHAASISGDLEIFKMLVEHTNGYDLNNILNDNK